MYPTVPMTVPGSVFFVTVGAAVNLELLSPLKAENAHTLALGAGLVLVAIAGKLASGLVAGRGVRGLVVGTGMIPRGEVGLLFAGVGRTTGVLDDALFGAVVAVVLVTTLIAPPLLSWAYRRSVGSRVA